jgi:tRNA1Val (adenine37-N6)-methyltransferase
MSNTYFQFKQFLIEQEHCAMKVGTDSVLLATLTNIKDVKLALDIGTGTGILALMLAQKSPTIHFDAIEIDKQAFFQASANVTKSKFAAQISVHFISLQQFMPSNKYDLIITNPPYFISKSNYSITDLQRAKARHNNDLSFEELLNYAKNMLSLNGILSLILPVNEAKIFKQLALQNGFFCKQSVLIKPKTSKPTNRVIMDFTTKKTVEVTKELIIYQEDNAQTVAYKNLTEPYYI